MLCLLSDRLLLDHGTMLITCGSTLPGTDHAQMDRLSLHALLHWLCFLRFLALPQVSCHCPACLSAVCIQAGLEHLSAAIPLQVSAADGMSDHCMYLLAHPLRQLALLSAVVAALCVKKAVCAVQL